MKRFFALSGLCAQMLLATPVVAAENDPVTDIVVPAADTTLEDWLWLKRPVVVFADSPNDPRFREQIELLLDRPDALDDRDVVVITDSDPAARNAVRQALRPRGFALVVMAKDGTIVTRKPRPWSVREITRSIDKLPLRQDELRSQ